MLDYVILYTIVNDCLRVLGSGAKPASQPAKKRKGGVYSI